MIIASWWPNPWSWPWFGTQAGQAEKPQQRVFDPSRPPRPNYNKIHSQPLPVSIYPLPLLVPHNPISILHIALVYISQLVSHPPSHPKPLCKAYWSPETHSVHVTDEETIRYLWENGFFGKGSLSRSEPTWLEREKKRLGVVAASTSEDYTRLRREERKQFKNERAKKEREAIEERLREESGAAPNGTLTVQSDGESGKVEDGSSTVFSQMITEPNSGSREGLVVDDVASPSPASPQATDPSAESATIAAALLTNREHLQLTPQEALFLTYGLGILDVYPSPNALFPLSPPTLLTMFRTHSYFPPRAPSDLTLSDPFLLSYVVYHHFRSLGWVVRSGIKFGVDYLLYQRGPAFAHAQFSIVIVPSYLHTYRAAGKKETVKANSWWWLHAVNRVQSQVLKNLVVCFVEVPPPGDGEGGIGEVKDITGLLGRYKVREVVIKRWTPNRMRD